MPGSSTSAAPSWRDRLVVAALLAPALVEPSIPPLVKFAGPWLAATGVVLELLLFLALGDIVARLRDRLSPRAAARLALGLLALVTAAILVVYPRANVHAPGRGSDRDDALVVATTALLHGEHPYRTPTYLGNPITPLPGALLLAAPFVLLGAIALQSVLWLGVLYLVIRVETGDALLALVLLAITVVSPGPLLELLTGGDLLANGIYVMAAGALLRRIAARHGPGPWLAAVAVGIALASRFTYVYLLPLLCAALATRVGWRRAVALSTATFGTFVLLFVPLWLADPAAFAPLHMRDKLARFAGEVPQPELLVPALTALVALLACLPLRSADRTFDGRALVVVGFPTFLLAALALVSPHIPVREYLGMALSFTAFGTTAAGVILSRRPPDVAR